jgi:peptidoglycan/LPS O-acetylase OafA/YrhL
MQNERSDFFDAMRALAILPVMLHHVYSPAAPGGGLGVSVFFVLSGYLIGQTLLADSGTNFQRAAKFVVRRVLRITPLYYLAVAAVVYLVWASGRPDFDTIWNRLPSILAFQDQPESLGYSVDVWWTLCVEMLFYSIVAGLALALGPEKVVRLAPVFLALSIVAAAHAAGPLEFLPQLFLGLALNTLPTGESRGAACLSAVAVLLLLWLYTAADVTQISHGAFIIAAHAAAICAAGLIYFARPLLRGVSLPILAHVGRISFSLYLVHALVLDFGGHWYATGPPENIDRQLRFFAISILISCATYVLVEKPGQRLAKALCNRLNTARPRGLQVEPIG